MFFAKSNNDYCLYCVIFKHKIDYFIITNCNHYKHSSNNVKTELKRCIKIITVVGVIESIGNAIYCNGCYHSAVCLSVTRVHIAKALGTSGDGLKIYGQEVTIFRQRILRVFKILILPLNSPNMILAPNFVFLKKIPTG